MQTMADGPKQGFLRIGLGIVRSEGTRGLYHGVSISPSNHLQLTLLTPWTSSQQVL